MTEPILDKQVHVDRHGISGEAMNKVYAQLRGFTNEELERCKVLGDMMFAAQEPLRLLYRYQIEYVLWKRSQGEWLYEEQPETTA